jgi:hypothetical protein
MAIVTIIGSMRLTIKIKRYALRLGHSQMLKPLESNLFPFSPFPFPWRVAL